MKLPKNTKDWHHDLVIAATQRFNLAVQGNKKTQNIWRVALHQLERSQNPVYVMKSGGRLRGLPKKLDGRIYDVFRDIVNGIEPVVNIQVPMQRVNFREESLYKRTKYRDGRYSFLASIYSLTADEHSYIYGNVIKAGMRNFTDLEVEGDRWGKRGAWKAKDTVVERGLVSEDKTYGPHRFLLTPLGLDFCRALFTEKFHPSISANYVLVKPRAGFVPNNGQQVEDINDRVPHNLVRLPAEVPNRFRNRKMSPTLLDDEDNQDFDPHNDWEDEQYGIGLFPGGGEDDNKNDIASTISAVIPSSRDRAMIAQARIAMFEKSRPAIQGRHVPPSVAVEPKTELHDWTDESKEKFLSHLSEVERQKLDEHLASLLREGLSEEEAWAVSKDTAREDRRKQLKTQQEEDLQMALWNSRQESKAKGPSLPDAFEDSQEQMDFALTLSASEYDAINDPCHVEDDYEPDEISWLDPGEPRDEFEADWESDSNSDGNSTFELELESSSQERFLSPADYESSSSSRSKAVPSQFGTRPPEEDRHVVTIDEASPPTRAVIVNLIEAEGSPRTPLRRIDNHRMAPPSTCRSVIRSLRDCVVDLTSDGPDSSGKKGPSAASFPDGNLDDSSSGIFGSPRKKSKYSQDVDTPSKASSQPVLVSSASSSSLSSSSLSSFEWIGGSIQTAATVALLVDLRERKDQGHYRSFFHSIAQKCDGISTPDTPVHVVQQSLHLGDFLFAYEQGDDLLLSQVLVERKSIKDIVGTSADRSGTGSASRCWKQERRMRFCSLRTPIMLIEGKIVDASIRKVRPLISKESDMEKPDVIACSSELESYLAAVVCRNVGAHRIFITQTFDSGHTAAYLAAMSLMLAADAGSRANERRPLLMEFSKHCSGWGGGKRGRDSEFQNDLQRMAASTQHSDAKDDRAVVELSMRATRRFGDWNALRSALDCCASALSKRLLLVGLQVGGSNHNADRFISNYELSDSDSDESLDDDDEALALPLCPQLALCDEIVARVFPDRPLERINTVLPSTVRKVVVGISQSMLASFGEDYPAYVQVVSGMDSGSPTPTTIHVEQTLFGCWRRSEVISVAVLPGDCVVEWFIDSMAALDATHWGGHDGNPLMKLLAAAKATARRCLDAAWGQQPASQQSSTAIKEQRVIVLENLIQANLSNGSFGKLAARIPSPDEDRTTAIFFPLGKGKPKGPGCSQTSNSSSSNSSSDNALSSGRALSVSAARSVSASATKLFNLLICILQVELGVQVYNVNKAEDTASFLRSLVREAHRQMLLTSTDA